MPPIIKKNRYTFFSFSPFIAVIILAIIVTKNIGVFCNDIPTYR